MKKAPAIASNGRVGHQNSEEHGHDTGAMIARYRSLETKDTARLVKQSKAAHATK